MVQKKQQELWEIHSFYRSQGNGSYLLFPSSFVFAEPHIVYIQLSLFDDIPISPKWTLESPAALSLHSRLLVLIWWDESLPVKRIKNNAAVD